MAHAAGQIDHAAEARPATVVGAGVMIRGDIEGATDLQVHGMVLGKVDVGDLVVEGDALIDGPVTADAVIVSGRVIGPIKARTIHLSSSARLEGDVTCQRLAIDAGARFTGRCIAEDAAEAKVVPISRAALHDDGAGDAGQELLRLAARLRQVTS